MSINISENEYQKVLADIEADLESVLKSESDALSKAFPPGDDDAAGSPEASAGGESADAAPAESSDAPPAEGSESAPADAGAPPDASASPEGAPPAADPAAGGEEDLESKLMNLPEEQLRHLYMAAKQALFARMSQQGAPGAGGPPGAPPAPGLDPAAGAPPDASAAPAGAPPGIGAPPPAAPPAADPSQIPPPAMKSDAGLGLMKPKSTGEMSSNKANGGPGPGAVKLGKSEENEEMAEMKTKLELMAKAVTMLIGQPMRKAITGISQLNHLPKNDGSNEKVEVKLSKAQITDKLKSLDQAKLTKSDRTAINTYYNKFEVGGIAHLLK